MLKYSLGIHNK